MGGWFGAAVCGALVVGSLERAVVCSAASTMLAVAAVVWLVSVANASEVWLRRSLAALGHRMCGVSVANKASGSAVRLVVCASVAASSPGKAAPSVVPCVWWRASLRRCLWNS